MIFLLVDNKRVWINLNIIIAVSELDNSILIQTTIDDFEVKGNFSEILGRLGLGTPAIN
jgi:hypothetical protein